MCFWTSVVSRSAGRIGRRSFVNLCTAVNMIENGVALVKLGLERHRSMDVLGGMPAAGLDHVRLSIPRVPPAVLLSTSALRPITRLGYRLPGPTSFTCMQTTSNHGAGMPDVAYSCLCGRLWLRNYCRCSIRGREISQLPIRPKALLSEQRPAHPRIESVRCARHRGLEL